MEQPISFENITIKCDVPWCGYSAQVASMDDLQKLADAMCPKCGARLLSDEDVELFRMMTGVAGYVNAIVGPVEPDGEPVVIPIDSAILRKSEST